MKPTLFRRWLSLINQAALAKFARLRGIRKRLRAREWVFDNPGRALFPLRERGPSDLFHCNVPARAQIQRQLPLPHQGPLRQLLPRIGD